jgi:NADP-dependent 3-hydroxy acid dehydrogenase YdfG
MALSYSDCNIKLNTQPKRANTMNTDLTNKRIVITGITGGIAKASAQRLATEGAEVIVSARSEEKLGKSAG